MALAQVDKLASRLGAGGDRIRVADVRWYLKQPGAGRAAYEAGHIPGAIFIDLDEDLSDPEGLGAPGRHPLPTPAVFAQRMSGLGIGSNHFVVAYDDAGGTIAARLWWMLDNLGHKGGVAVLDGGIGAWTAAGHPLSQSVPNYPPARLELAQHWTNVTTRDELNERLGSVSLLDARAAERYRGEVEPIDPLAGHIPTAISAPTTDNLAPNGHLKTAVELRRHYSALAGDLPVVTYCGSGTSACHNSLSMRVAGMPDPILYVGSFSDWSRSGMPVATGSEAIPVLDA
jgi:thiosulfate/3-mercaptopyruvate sulfurtransferase